MRCLTPASKGGHNTPVGLLVCATREGALGWARKENPVSHPTGTVSALDLLLQIPCLSHNEQVLCAARSHTVQRSLGEHHPKGTSFIALH